MLPVSCPHCARRMELDESLDFRPFSCPYCGGGLQVCRQGKALYLQDAILPQAVPDGSHRAKALVDQALKENNPRKRYQRLMDALSLFPEDFSVHEALLYHGRLHEPLCGKSIDYSIFKCHLLSIFEHPGDYTPEDRLKKLNELLFSAQLKKTMALSGNPDAFFEEYLRRLAKEYLELFILGVTKNQQTLFGIRRSDRSKAQLCAQSVKTMLRGIDSCSEMKAHERRILKKALYESYLKFFPGGESLLS